MIAQLRAYLARRPDPYARGDIDHAQRIGSVLFAVQFLLRVGLLPLSHPGSGLGGADWALAAATLVATAAACWAMHLRRLGSWPVLLATAYGSAAMLALMQWIAGGVQAPYERVMLLPAFFVAAIQPPRRIAAFLGFLLLAMALPFVYDHWDPQAAGGTAASWVILAAVPPAACGSQWS